MPIYSDHQNLRDGLTCGQQESEPLPPTSTSTQRSQKPLIRYVEYERQPDLSPTTSLYPRSSVDTYDSTIDSTDDLSLDQEDDLSRYLDLDYIPPLPSYTHEISEPNVRPSTFKDFAKLFPSMNRLSIRHDDFTSDGNMNLRVDTLLPGRPRTAVQLYHLRMYDLGKRDFSLRRYCRDSGREVCNAKRAPPPPAPTATSRPTLQRSMSSAMKTLTGAAKRQPSSRRHNSSTSTISSGGKQPQRPATSHSYEDEGGVGSVSSSRASLDHHHHHRQSHAIKLEFSNYARVDVTRKGAKAGKRYEFSWWGHRYAWRRVVEKHMEGVVSFHLLREGQAAPVAHIVPETRSPIQVEDDERAGGWVPPCYMWISDQSVLDAATDVADVIVASGLLALVDDCIRERWQTKKAHRLPVLGDMGAKSPRAFMQRMFSTRRLSADQHHSPLRYAGPISTC